MTNRFPRSPLRLLRILIVALAVMMMVSSISIARAQPASAAPTEGGKRPLVVFIGNSFTGGSAVDSGGIARYPSLLSADLGFRWMTITADGSGYAARGNDSARFVDLAARVPEAADVVIVLGSDDDANRKSADIRAGAAETYARIHAQASGATILVIASPWGERPTPKGVLTARNAVRDAALQDGNAFVDAIADGWWVTGPSGQIGADKVHPTDSGQAEMARRISPVLTKLLGDRSG